MIYESKEPSENNDSKRKKVIYESNDPVVKWTPESGHAKFAFRSVVLPLLLVDSILWT